MQTCCHSKKCFIWRCSAMTKRELIFWLLPVKKYEKKYARTPLIISFFCIIVPIPLFSPRFRLFSTQFVQDSIFFSISHQMFQPFFIPILPFPNRKLISATPRSHLSKAQHSQHRPLLAPPNPHGPCTMLDQHGSNMAPMLDQHESNTGPMSVRCWPTWDRHCPMSARDPKQKRTKTYFNVLDWKNNLKKQNAKKTLTNSVHLYC